MNIKSMNLYFPPLKKKKKKKPPMSQILGVK